MRLGDRELLDEEIARRIEHLALPEGELLVPLQHEEVTQHFGDLEHASGLDLLRILAVASVPRLLIDLDLLVAQDLVDLGDHVLADDAPQTDRLNVLGRDHDRHVAVDDAEHVELAFATGDHLRLYALDDTHAVGRVHDLLSDFEHSSSCGHSGRLPSHPLYGEPPSYVNVKMCPSGPASGRRDRLNSPKIQGNSIPERAAYRPRGGPRKASRSAG